jgi:hypothetical protein
LRNITFTGISEINAAIKPRLAILNNQSFQKMKTSRRELFEAVDKPALKPLPPERYHYAEWIDAKIHIDYHFVFDDHYYCVPYQYIHHPVQIRATAKTVECFYQGKRIAAHARSHVRYGFTTLEEHMPPAHLAHVKWSPARMKCWAKKIGSQTSQFIDHHFSHNFGHGYQNLSTVFGMLMMLAFLVDQVQELSCHLFKKARAKFKSRTSLWESIRSIFKHYLVNSWEIYSKVLQMDITKLCLCLILHNNILSIV